MHREAAAAYRTTPNLLSARDERTKTQTTTLDDDGDSRRAPREEANFLRAARARTNLQDCYRAQEPAARDVIWGRRRMINDYLNMMACAGQDDGEQIAEPAYFT